MAWPVSKLCSKKCTSKLIVGVVMQQGDIVIYYKKSLKDASIGIAYDSKLIVTAGWRGISLMPLRMLKMGNNCNILVYRTTQVLSHMRKTKLRNIVIDIIMNHIKLPLRERFKFERFIIRLYHDILGIKIVENFNRNNMIERLSNSDYLNMVESYSSIPPMRM